MCEHAQLGGNTRFRMEPPSVGPATLHSGLCTMCNPEETPDAEVILQTPTSNADFKRVLSN